MEVFDFHFQCKTLNTFFFLAIIQFICEESRTIGGFSRLTRFFAFLCFQISRAVESLAYKTFKSPFVLCHKCSLQTPPWTSTLLWFRIVPRSFASLLCTWTLLEANQSGDSFLIMECPHFPTETHFPPNLCSLFWIWQKTDSILSSIEKTVFAILALLAIESESLLGVQHKVELFVQ